MKILDMGLARLRRPTEEKSDGSALHQDATNPLTAAGVVMMGTPDYLAPEQALNFHGADIRADIYSLGCTFYFLLTGEAPFAAYAMPEKLVRHQQSAPRPVRDRRSDVPVEVTDILDRMLAKRPEDRYSHPQEVANALAAVLVSFPSEKSGLRGAVNRARLVFGRATRFIRKRRWQIAAVGGVLLTVVGAAVTPLLLMDRLRPPGEHLAAGPSESDPEVSKSKEQPARPMVGKERVWKVETAVTGVTVNRDHVVAAAVGDAVHLWDAVTGKELRAALSHPKKVRAVAFSPDGKNLATGCDDQLIRIWPLTGGTSAVLQGQNAAITCLAFSPDGRTLASAGDGRAVVLWDVAKGERLFKLSSKIAKKLHAHEYHVSSIAFDPHGKWLATCDPVLICAWNLQNLRTGSAPERTPNRTHCSVVRFLPTDGQTLVAGGKEGIRMLDVPSFKRPVIRRNPGIGVCALAISTDGFRLASGGTDGFLRLWDVITLKQLANWKTHDAAISDVVYSPDQSYIVTAGEDGSVKLWLAGHREKSPGP